MTNAENHLNKLKMFVFGQTTKQILSTFEPWKSWKYRQLWGLGPDPSCLFKKKKSVKQFFLTNQYYYPHLNNLLKSFQLNNDL